uniref:tRNA:m(4)X modification enzyme TRM13 n=1 Tax=Auxenochlorella protothecoides TaxID=3075 RepID=A0A1D1ZQ98_AUXPR
MNAPQKCQFFLTQKNRTCKFDVVPGKNYCGNHLPQAEGSRPRIRCPWDPAGAHEIYADEVEKHRLKCPAYLQIQAQRAAPYYQLDINAGAALDVEPIPGACLPGHSMAERRAAYAATLGPDGLDDLIERVCQAAERLPPLPPVDALNQAAAAPPAPAPGVTTPPYSAKHAAQQASIVGHLERHGLLRCVADDVIVELGAGRGYLGAAVAGHCASLTCLVLVDCRGFKLKADRALRHLDLHRLRCDLKDFSLAGCPGLDRPGPSGGAPPRSWVGVAKHLCGAASDFALRAAVEQAPRRCRGLGLATCCHHRCSWRAYVGKEWFAERGFAPAEFELVSWMSGWALCGHEAPAGAGCEEGDEDGATGPSAGTEPGASDQAGAAAPPLPGIPPHGAKRKAAGAGRPTSKQSSTHWQPHHHIPRSARIAVGQHCKALIDAGRLAYLTGRGGMEGVLVAYISPEVSGENKLLLGLRGRDPAL